MTPAAGWWLGLDRGDRDLQDLEAAALTLGDAVGATVVLTHVVRDGAAYHAASVAGGGVAPGPDVLTAAAAGAGGALVLLLDADDAPAWSVGDPDRRPSAAVVAGAHRERAGGRAVRFPGDGALLGTVAVADIPAVSAVEAVDVVGGAGDEAVLHADHPVRPAFLDGALRLAAVRASGGVLIPHERPRAHECGHCS